MAHRQLRRAPRRCCSPAQSRPPIARVSYRPWRPALGWRGSSGWRGWICLRYNRNALPLGPDRRAALEPFGCMPHICRRLGTHTPDRPSCVGCVSQDRRAAGGRRNSGNANAATGEQGELDARATAAETARLLGLDAEQVLVLSTGVIGLPLPTRRASSRAWPRRPQRSRADGGGDAAGEAIMTTDTRPKEAVVSRDGFTVGGMAKGAGMIHPNLATMLAVVTTDYPLEPGEPRLPPARGRRELQRDLGRRRVLDERHGRPARQRRERHRAHARDRRGIRRALQRGLRRARRGRSSPTARARPSCRDRGPRRGDRARRRRSRAGSRPRRSSRPRSSAATRTGAACSPPRAPPRTTAATPASTPDLLTLDFNGATVFDHGAPQGVEPDARRRRLPRSSSTWGSATASASYLTSDLSYDYVRINADYRS